MVDLERNKSVDKNIYVYKIVNVAKDVTLQDAKREMLGEFIDSSKIEVYKTLLKDIILEIKNKDIPFKANKSCNKCNYCGFGIICGKI